jgi:hypothetical protein
MNIGSTSAPCLRQARNDNKINMAYIKVKWSQNIFLVVISDSIGNPSGAALCLLHGFLLEFTLMHIRAGMTLTKGMMTDL